MIRCSIIFLLFFSCFNSNKIDKKSSSNFLAYYNTFYASEKYFNDALKIIQLNESESDKIPSQALSLLDDAIKNALIIEDKFYDTKYLDDAYYILGMASFYKKNITSSEYYFNRIVNEYNNYEYFNRSLIMLGNLNLKMNKINDLDAILQKLENSVLSSGEEQHLYYLLLAEYSSYNDDVENEKKYYLLALDNLKSSNDKISIYYKLLKLAEKEEDFVNAVLYIESIEILLDDVNLSEQLIEKWIEYNRKINDFDTVINQLSTWIDKEQLPKKIIYYNLEIAKTYIAMSEYEKAEDVILLLIDTYIDNTSMKNELSEAYYLLGNIYLTFYVNFDKSQEYYQYSIDKSKTSTYGKESQKIITSISNYNNLMDEIQYIKANSSDIEFEDSDTLSQNMFFDIPNLKSNGNYHGIDSLLFSAGQILYFDLGIIDSALYKFEDIIANFSDSSFRYKSLIIADIEFPDSNWKQIMLNDYPNINLNNKKTIVDSLVDVAYDTILSSKEKTLDKLIDIYSEYDDEKVLYSIGFIYDDYYMDIDKAMFYYNTYLDKFPDGNYFTEINNRISELAGMLEFNFKFIEQKINSRRGIDFFKNNFQIDSSLFYLNLGKVGIDRDLKSYCSNILESIKLYRDNDSLYRVNYSNIDSVKINLAHILYKDLSFDSLAVPFYKDLILNSESSKNINESLAALSALYGNGKWDSILYSNVQDSNLFSLLKNNSYRKFEYDFKVSYNQDKEDFDWFYTKYNEYFNSNNE